jgi:hypothetical protein
VQAFYSFVAISLLEEKVTYTGIMSTDKKETKWNFSHIEIVNYYLNLSSDTNNSALPVNI